jgi:hypothetical protein
MTAITINDGNGKTTKHNVDFTRILKDVTVQAKPHQLKMVMKRFTAGKNDNAFGMAYSAIGYGNGMSETQFAEKYAI